MKRLPTHAGIGKNLVGLFGGDDNLLAADQAGCQPNQDDDNADSDHFLLLKVHGSCFQARTYSMLKVDGRSLSSGVTNLAGILHDRLKL